MIESVQQVPVPSKFDRKSKIATCFLALFIFCALAAPWLPLPFTPNEIDLEHVYQPPLQWVQYAPEKPFHWLGTDRLGRDLLATIVFGARTALIVSFPAMLLAAILGIYLGSVAGFYGDTNYKKPLSLLVGATLAAFFFLFYVFLADTFFITQNILWQQILLKAIILGLTVMLYKFLAVMLHFIPVLRSEIALPLDLLILKVIELIQSVPRLLLVLSLATLVKKTSLMLVIGLSAVTYWPTIARLVRSEMLRIKQLSYLEAARALGLSHQQIILKHALPNALTPVIIALAFGISNLMALESTLSFLGIGISVEVPSWGRVFNDFRHNLSAWWLALFPGLVLCGVILSVQTVAQLVIRIINPK